MPGISAYSAAKGALERWAEALAPEIAPFGLGMGVLVAGTFRTDILEKTSTWADHDGPYAPMHSALEAVGPVVQRFAAPPERFAAGLNRALSDTSPFRRRGVGIDAHVVLLANRLMPTRLFTGMVGRALRLPRPGSLVNDPLRKTAVTVQAEGGRPAS